MPALMRSAQREKWEEPWLEADYSWKGLCGKAAPAGASHPQLQEFIRRISYGLSDEQLLARGILIDLGKKRGLYHILFIPPHWIKLEENKIEQFNEQKEKLIVHLLSQIGELDATALSGMSLRINGNSPLRKVRRFEGCYVEGDIELRHNQHHLYLKKVMLDGAIKIAPNSQMQKTIEVSQSVIKGSIQLSGGFHNPISLALSKSVVIEAISLFNSAIDSVTIRHSDFADFSSSNSVFRELVLIENCEVRGGVISESCEFKKNVAISQSTIRRFLRILDCDFIGRLVFREVTWPEHKISHAYTTGSRFKELVTFSSKTPPPIQFFDGGEFEGNASFDSRYQGRWDPIFFAELNQKVASPQARWQLASRVEGGCRNLRKLAQNRGEGHMEQFWHRAEIIARRSTGSVGKIERSFSFAYGKFADYGLSIGRPFIWLFLCIVFFGVLYAYLGGSDWYGGLDVRSLEQGVGLSLHQAFPLGVFKDSDDAWLNGLLGKEFGFANVVTRLVATFQTIVSAILIYLGVMAIRRKFKIS